MQGFSLALILLLVINTSEAISNSEGVDFLFSLSLEELQLIPVSGVALYQQKLLEAPSATTVFNHTQISRLGVDTLNELMHLVPGFQNSRNGGSGLISPVSSRGRRISGSSSEVLILMDGQRLDSPDSSGSANFLPYIPLAMFERVEFIRGPGSSVYGSNAMMGVINLITRKGVNSLSFGIGSDERYLADITQHVTKHDIKIDNYIHLEKDGGQHYRVYDRYEDTQVSTQDPIEQYTINLKLNKHDHNLSLLYFNSISDDFYQSGNILNGFNGQVHQYAAISYEKEIEWLGQAGHIWLSHHRTYREINVIASRGNLFTNISTPSSDAPLLISGKMKDQIEDRLSLQFQKKLEQGLITYGGEYRRLDVPRMSVFSNFNMLQILSSDFPVESSTGFDFETEIQVASTRNILGVFGQYERSIMDDVNMTFGLRYDDFSNIGQHISPRLAFIIKTAPQHVVKILMGQAFRAPGGNELGLRNNPAFLGNENLEPETATNYEIVFMGQYPKMDYALSVFETHFDNAIIRTSNSDDVLQFQNIEQDPIKGTELEMNWQAFDNTLLKFNLTWLHEKADSSFRSSGKLMSLTLNHERNKWNHSLSLSYYGDSQMIQDDNVNAPITIDSYEKIYLKSIYRISPKLSAFLQAKNALDSQIKTAPELISLQEGILNRGREWLLGLKYDF